MQHTLQGLLQVLLWWQRVVLPIRRLRQQRQQPLRLGPQLMKLPRLQVRQLAVRCWLVGALRMRLVLRLARLLRQLEDRQQHRERRLVRWWLVVVDHLPMLVLQLPRQ